MATRAISCRVCRKMFIPCNKTSAALGAFNYHAIACSSECGAEYLHRVQAARQEPSEQSNDVKTLETELNEAVNKEESKRSRGRRRETNLTDK